MNKQKIIFILLVFFNIIVFSKDLPVNYINIYAQKITLDNGFSYIYDKDENSKNTVLQMAFYGGNRSDIKELKGISQIASRLFIQISGSDNVKSVVTKNSICYIRVKDDYLIITIECISENLEEAVGIFFKTIGDPDITSLRLNYMKTRIVQMQNSVVENYINILNEAIKNAFFKGSGYVGCKYGNPESIKNLSKKKISKYHKETINRSNMVLTISTDLSEKIISKILKKKLKYFEIGKRKEKKMIKPTEIVNNEIRKKLKGDLITIANAFPLWFENNRISRKDILLGRMLETYLGRGIGSYLWPLRSEENLTYSINSKAIFFKPFGYIYYFIRTNNANTDRSLSRFKSLMSSLYLNGVDKQTLDSIISYTSASFLRNNETKRASSYNLAFFEILGIGFDFHNEFSEEIKKVTLAEFNEYLKTTLNPLSSISIILGD